MFKTQASISLAITLLSFSPLQAPDPPASLFSVPDGALPWSLPAMPSATINLTAPSLSLDTIEHSDNYAALVAQVEDRETALTGPMLEMIDSLEALAGPGGALPDMSSGEDSDTGLDPNDAGSMTIADFQDEFVGNITSVFTYARLAQSIVFSPMAPVFAALFVFIAWQLLVRVVLFSVQLFDMAVSLIDKLKEIILILFG